MVAPTVISSGGGGEGLCKCTTYFLYIYIYINKYKLSILPKALKRCA